MRMSTTAEPGTGVWGVGWYPTPHGPEAFTASHALLDAQVERATAHLGTLGVRTDDILVFVGRTSESLQLAPWEHAANALGAAICVVDGYRSDAHRLVAYVSQFSPRAILGLDDEVVDGAASAGLAALLGTAALAARPRAGAALAAMGLPSRLWIHAGPIVAFECSPGAGAHLDPRWGPELADGTLSMRSPDGDERLSIDGFPVAELIGGTCACGSDEPRLVGAEAVDWGD